ncbi:MAG: glycosyltransferase family 4 protein [Magnetococcales bacterium]|nr:glycosyltransferase family 4 protein [Magnetococcales bacterium]
MPDSNKKILVYYSDQVAGSSHASVESLFYRALNDHYHVIVVYYDRQASATAWLQERRIVIPYRWRGRWLEALSLLLPLESVDFVLVRNIFPAYGNALRHRTRFGFKVCFHYSFPHTYRHYYAEGGQGFAKARKWLTYRVNHFFQMRLMRRADGFLPISERMPGMLGLPGGMPVFPVHSGVDFDLLPPPADSPLTDPVRRFLYIGTMDALRRMEVVLQAFDRLESPDWRLDIYTAQEAFTRRLISHTMPNRSSQVTVFPALPRAELYDRMRTCHIALCLIPPTPLYQVSSPLKLMEYYAMGLPVVMSRLPECLNLFEHAGCGWFADFHPNPIHAALEQALNTPLHQTHQMGQMGRAIVFQHRNYAGMAARLADFLSKLTT